MMQGAILNDLMQQRQRWAPFVLALPGQRGQLPRSIQTSEGLGDRIRLVAFAELQAWEAFQWAIDHYGEVPIREGWNQIVQDEKKHYHWLMERMQVLGIVPADRLVSDELWVSLRYGEFSVKEFSIRMANAECRGLKAGIQFYQELKSRDPITAEIFLKIALEESKHIQWVVRFFPEYAPVELSLVQELQLTDEGLDIRSNPSGL